MGPRQRKARDDLSSNKSLALAAVQLWASSPLDASSSAGITGGHMQISHWVTLMQICADLQYSLSSLAFSSMLLRVPVLKQMSPSRNTASAHIWYGTGFCATRSLKEGPSSGSMQRKGKAVFNKKLKWWKIFFKQNPEAVALDDALLNTCVHTCCVCCAWPFKFSSLQ